MFVSKNSLACSGLIVVCCCSMFKNWLTLTGFKTVVVPSSSVDISDNKDVKS